MIKKKNGLERLKNIEGKNKGQLKAIKDQGKKQLGTIKKQKKNQLEVIRENVAYLKKGIDELFRLYPKSFDKRSIVLLESLSRNENKIDYRD